MMAEKQPSFHERSSEEQEATQHVAKHGLTDRVDDLANVEASTGWFSKFTEFAGKVRAEERGIERVDETDRVNQSMLDGFTLWASANFTPATFATGALGAAFGLGFWDSFSVIIVVNFFFSWLVGFFGTLGPLTGLRTISIGRFSFGIWGTRVLVILNLCGMIGWSAVNGIAGAQILTAITNGQCPLWAGVLVITVLVAIITFFGYFAVHLFERFCWIPQLIVFIFLAGYGAKHFKATAAPIGSGAAEVAGVLSFIAVTYGFVVGWASLAADYNVRMPVNINKKKLATTTWAANFIGTVTPETIGAAFMTAVAADPKFATAYSAHGYGDIMGEALKPLGGFGKFLLALLALSIIGCNLTNNYSMAFAVQNFHPILLKVPRWVWSIVGSGIILAVAIPGATHFEAVLESFLSVLGYYLTPFVCVVLIEHCWFRKRKYPLEDWNNMNVLPYGIAGFMAIAAGFAGAVLSMDQTWYVGVVAKAVGPYGAEMGWVFSGSFSVIFFVPIRYLEMKYTGR